MPFLVEIDGYQLDMGDGFGQLAPQDQQKALEEAGEYIKARGGPRKPQETPSAPQAPKGYLLWFCPSERLGRAPRGHRRHSPDARR